MVGKMDAIEKTSTVLPTHKRTADSRPRMIKTRLTNTSAQVDIEDRFGVDTGGDPNPKQAPQHEQFPKPEVRYAAVMTFARFKSNCICIDPVCETHLRADV